MKISPKNPHRRLGSNSGFTIVEAAIAGAILAVFLTGIYDANWRALSLMKAGRESTSASRLIENRIEQIRTQTWKQIVKSSYISGTLLASTTASNDLGNLLETITVAPYPLPGGYYQGGALPGSAVQVTRDVYGNVTTVQNGDGTLTSANTVRVDITERWNATLTSSTESRMMSTLVSQGGIYGRNQ